MITLSSLHYLLNKEPFFKDLSVSFEPGYIHALSGKNGVGKSTLLRIVHGECNAQAGNITIDGKQFDLSHVGTSIALKKVIGFVPQQAHAVIIPELTVAENLSLAAVRKVGLLSALPQIDTTLIESFNIPLHVQAQTLSGGQKHILAIAMVMQQHRSVLLLDEPIAALDDENAGLVIACIASLVKRGITIIMVTHDQLASEVPVKQWKLIKLPDNSRTILLGHP